MKTEQAGELIVDEEEGGYSTPLLSVGGNTIQEIIERVTGKLPKDGPTGKHIRITVELLSTPNNQQKGGM